MHPTPQEKAIIDEAEKIMIENMARYDPSHDQYHGERDPAGYREIYGPTPYVWTRFYSVQRVRNTALALAKNISPTPDLLIIELGFWRWLLKDPKLRFDMCPSSCLASWCIRQKIRYTCAGCGPLCILSAPFYLNGSFTWGWSCRRWTRSNYC